MNSGVANDPFDPICCLDDVLVLPNPYHGPARISKPSIGVSIALDIGLDFCSPPHGIVLWPRAVLGASMPEASVQEDGNSGDRKGNVHRSPASLDQFAVEPKTQATAMQLRAQRSFTSVVALRGPHHAFRGLRRYGLPALFNISRRSRHDARGRPRMPPRI